MAKPTFTHQSNLSFWLGCAVAACCLTWGLYINWMNTEYHFMGYDLPLPFHARRENLVGLISTLLPAIVCTLIAIFKVGLFRSKFAWLSLLAFVPVYYVAKGMAIVGIFIIE